ncbi:MAG: DNA translocase FtsK 4TM domain-containing protein, partial [Candidatus Dependentiae bacterium]
MQEPWNTEELEKKDMHRTPTADDRPATSSIPGGRDIHRLLGGIAWVWTFCALATFSPKDSSFFHVVLPLEAVRNWCGTLGAHMAAILYVFFGMAAWSFLLLGLWAVPLRSWQTARRLKTRTISFALWMMSSATLLQMIGFSLLAPTPGGMLGASGVLVKSFVGTVGCVLVYAIVATASFLNVIQVSYAIAWQAAQWALRATLSLTLRGIKGMFRLIFAKAGTLWSRGGQQKEDEPFAPLQQHEERARQPEEKTELPPVQPLAPSRDPQDIVIDDIAEAAEQGSAHATAEQEEQAEGAFAVEETPFAVEAAQNEQRETPALAIGDEVRDADLPYELEDGKDAGDDYPTSQLFAPADEFGSGDDEREPTADELEEIDEDEIDDLLEEPVLEDEKDSDLEEEGGYFTGEESEGEANDAEWHAAPADDDTEMSEPVEDDADDEDDDDDDSSDGGGGGYFMPGTEEDDLSVTPATSPTAEEERTFSGSSTSEDDAVEAASEEIEEEPEQVVYQAPEPFELPSMEIFSSPEENHADDAAFHQVCEERARVLTTKLAHFGINGRVAGIHPGPVITLFEYEPEVGSKVSKILALEDDLALSLKALSIRIIAPVPGKNVVG